MQSSKIKLSEEELAMVQNSHWLLTKNKILKTVFELFGELADFLQPELSQLAGDEWEKIRSISPKISKGENYLGLPYVMLDYPRLFGKQDTLAIRTMFWWGNFVSITLLLKGTYRQQFLPKIKNQLQELISKDFHVGIAEDEWQHEFSDANYLHLAKTDSTKIDELLNQKAFCKLSVKIPLSDWNVAKEKLIDLYKVCLEILKH